MTRRFLFACLLSAGASAVHLTAQNQKSPAQQNDSRQSQAPKANDEGNVPEEEDESVAPRKYTLDPLESDRNIKVGNFYWSKRDYRAALSRYEEASRYNPSSPEAFFKIGEAEEKLKHQDAARTAFQKVIQIAPETKLAQEAKKKLSRKG